MSVTVEMGDFFLLLFRVSSVRLLSISLRCSTAWHFKSTEKFSNECREICCIRLTEEETRVEEEESE